MAKCAVEGGLNEESRMCRVLGAGGVEFVDERGCTVRNTRNLAEERVNEFKAESS